jgi:hypothetical protein
MFEIVADADAPNDGNPEYELDIDFDDNEPDFQDSDYVIDGEEPDLEVHYQDSDYGTDWIISRNTDVYFLRRIANNDNPK